MEAILHRWADIDEDNPIPLLFRKRVSGAQMLVAKVRLKKGCQVAMHHHDSEQMAIVLSGKVRWTIGEDRRIVEVGGGEVLELPSNVPHAVEALEDTDILDILSPPGPMGVDNQRA